MSDYLVYSVCEEIVDRVKNADIPFIGGCVWENDLEWSIEHLHEEGHYSEDYKKTLTDMVKNPKKYHWTIEGQGELPCSLEDIQLFTGDIASIILNADEFNDHTQFGFHNQTSMIGTVSAYIIDASRTIAIREGYKWVNAGVMTEVTGDMHSDLRIFQTDVRHYKTIDPFGNEIPMRPVKRSIVAPYHSTEAYLLVAVMKYAEQMGVEYRSSDLVEWGKSLGQGGGTCTEHFGGFDHDASLFFICYDDIPSSGHTRYLLPCMGGETGYGVYIDDGDMVLKYNNDIRARFKPNDSVELMRALIYQSASGLGRTSAKQLFDIIEYRFGDEFGKEKY